MKNPKKAAKVLSRLDGRLNNDTFRSEATSALGIDSLPTVTQREPNRKERRSLPKECSGCGWTVDGDDVDWGETGADCPACGNGLNKKK